MKSYLFLHVIISIFLIAKNAYGQAPALKFTHYGKEAGLNQSSVNAILQDSQGMLWIANFGGINSFDGYTFRSYINDFDDSTSISDNSVWAIYEDNETNLWFGTKSSLSLFNRETNSFSNYFIQEPGANTLAIKTIFQGLNGKLYVGSEGNGLYEFSLDNKHFIPIKSLPNDLKVTNIIEDHNGQLWVASENSGLYRLDKENGTVQHYYVDAGINLATVWSLLCDANGNIWVGTDTEGIVLWNPETDSFEKLSRINDSYLCGSKIKSMKMDSRDRIWIASATKGLSIYDQDLNVFYAYMHQSSDANTLFDNDVSAVDIGQNDVVWLGMYMNGFNKVIETPFHTLKHDPDNKNSLSNNNVYCTYKDSFGDIWFGTFGGGLNKYNLSEKSFTHYRHDPMDKNSISHDWIRIIYEDSKGQFWIGTWGGGLNKLDRKTGKFSSYLPDAENPDYSLNLNIVTALYENNKGELWVGTYGGGINIYQPKTDNFRSIRHRSDDANSLSDDHITSFHEDDKGFLWICTYGGGLNKYDYKTNQFVRFVPDKSNQFSLNNYKVLHIYPEQDYWWITTLGGGLNKFFPEQNRFEAFTTKDGLPDNTTMGMLKYKSGYWISTNSGLTYFNKDEESFSNYTSVDGLSSDDFNLEAYLIDKNGSFYFGAKSGITYFNPHEISPKNTFPNISIKSIEVDGEPISIEKSEEYAIPYDKRISFEYGAINPEKTEKIDYAYRIEGLHDEWQYVGKQRRVEFASLNPGSYTLQVKSTNSSRRWNEDFNELSFYIPPPWYMTWYFRIGLVLAILFCSVGYYLRRVNLLERQKRVLEQKVEERTKTIEEKNQDLNTSYEKLKKLEGFKESLTHMIAHDLKNPLATILGKSSGNDLGNAMQKIHKSGLDMLYLIEDMLEVQKFEEAKMKLVFHDTSLSEVIDLAKAGVLYAAQEKHITISNTVHEDLTVNIDSELCQRVFINLLSNAIKFSPFHSVIDINATPNDQKRAVVSVRDYGEGISDKVKHHIFEKYEQDKVRAYSRTKSIGLGLPFCKLVIEAHGGHIYVESVVEKGSTFFFDLEIVGTLTSIQSKITDIEKPKNRTKMSERDLELVCPLLDRMEALSIYEIGEWYEILQLLEEKGSPELKAWCADIREILVHFDTNSFNNIIESLKVDVRLKNINPTI